MSQTLHYCGIIVKYTEKSLAGNGVVYFPELKTSLNDLLTAGESASLEFKSSVRWDYNESRINKDLSKPIIRTIAALLNTKGGVLLLGVNDDGTICGIEKDLETLPNRNRDDFTQMISSLIHSKLGAGYWDLIDLQYPESDGKTVCMIKVEPSPEPVFVEVKGPSGFVKDFYIRAMNTTRALNVEDAYRYIEMHWGKFFRG